jgi:hypothetical protein
VLAAPTDPAQLAAVAAVARRRRVLLLSLGAPPPTGSARTTTYLGSPDPSELSGTFAVVHGGTSRVAALYAGDSWRPKADRAVATARRRGMPARALDVAKLGVRGALIAAGRTRPAVIVAAAPAREAVRWMRQGRRAGAHVPWVVIAASAPAAARAASAGRVAMEVPWSPAAQDQWLFTRLGEFASRYSRAYGRAAGTIAAQGATLGLILDGMIDRARSTDPSRMLAARALMTVPGFWGALRFRRGTSLPIASQLVLLDGGRIRQVAPIVPGGSPQSQLRMLSLSVPPGP